MLTDREAANRRERSMFVVILSSQWWLARTTGDDEDPSHSCNSSQNMKTCHVKPTGSMVLGSPHLTVVIFCLYHLWTTRITKRWWRVATSLEASVMQKVPGWKKYVFSAGGSMWHLCVSEQLKNEKCWDLIFPWFNLKAKIITKL